MNINEIIIFWPNQLWFVVSHCFYVTIVSILQSFHKSFNCKQIFKICKNLKLEEDCRNYYNNISSTQSPPDPMTHVKFKPFSHLGTTFMGFSWNHVDTEGILLPRTPPLCRVKVYLAQLLHSMVVMPVATCFPSCSWTQRCEYKWDNHILTQSTMICCFSLFLCDDCFNSSILPQII